MSATVERNLRKAGIKVSQITNTTRGQTFGDAWLVTIPKKISGSKRLRRQFCDRPSALNWGLDQLQGSRAVGAEFCGPTPSFGFSPVI